MSGTAPRIGLAAMALAATTGLWLVWTSVAAGSVGILHLVVIALIPTIVAFAAGRMLTRHASGWHPPALAYVTVYAATGAAELPAAFAAARAPQHPGIALTHVGITVLAAVTLVAATVTWHADRTRGSAPSPSSRAVAAAGGALLVVSSLLPRFTTTSGSGIVAPDAWLAGDLPTRVSAALFVLVVVAATTFVARSRHRRLWLGVVGGLAGTHVTAVASLVDPTAGAAGARPAAGTFLAVAGVAALLLALVTESRRGGAPVGSPAEDDPQVGPASAPPRTT